MKRTLLVLAMLACGEPAQPITPTPTPSARASPSASASAVASAVIDAEAPYVPHWIEDDYRQALTLARSLHKPLFVDASAVWCHTCKAMRTFVLDDPALPRSAFVWLSFDVEKDQNAAAAARFPSHVLPTFFIVDPTDESIHGRWEGAATVQQMRTVLADSANSIEMAHSSGMNPDDPFALLLAGHRATLEQKFDVAWQALEKARTKAPAGWSHEPDLLLALIKARAHRHLGCIDLAVEALTPEKTPFGATSVLTDFSAEALDCATLPSPAEAPKVAKLRELVETRVLALATDVSAPLSADDRADAWRTVWDAREARGNHAGALDAGKHRLAVIEEALTKTTDPTVATTFDGAKMETLEFLSRGEEAAKFLEERVKQLPDDYNPLHRLAHVYFKLGRKELALTTLDRGLQKAYGARKGLMLRLKADILMSLGPSRRADARAAVQAQVDLYRSLPEGEKKPAFLKAAEDALQKLQ